MRITKALVVAFIALNLIGLPGTARADDSSETGIADENIFSSISFLIKDFEISTEAFVVKNPKDGEFLESTGADELPALIAQEIVNTFRSRRLQADRYESGKAVEGTLILDGSILLGANPKVKNSFRVYRSEKLDENILEGTVKLKEHRLELLLLTRLPGRLARKMKTRLPKIIGAGEDAAH